MAIKIYLYQSGQTPDGEVGTSPLDIDPTTGNAYPGQPFVTRFLFQEAFEAGEAPIPAATLRERLPEALRLIEQRQRSVYGEASPAAVQRVFDGYTTFIEFCERMERSTGEAVTIVADY